MQTGVAGCTGLAVVGKQLAAAVGVLVLALHSAAGVLWLWFTPVRLSGSLQFRDFIFSEIFWFFF